MAPSWVSRSNKLFMCRTETSRRGRDWRDHIALPKSTCADALHTTSVLCTATGTRSVPGTLRGGPRSRLLEPVSARSYVDESAAHPSRHHKKNGLSICQELASRNVTVGQATALKGSQAHARTWGRRRGGVREGNMGVLGRCNAGTQRVSSWTASGVRGRVHPPHRMIQSEVQRRFIHPDACSPARPAGESCTAPRRGRPCWRAGPPLRWAVRACLRAPPGGRRGLPATRRPPPAPSLPAGRERS